MYLDYNGKIKRTERNVQMATRAKVLIVLTAIVSTMVLVIYAIQFNQKKNTFQAKLHMIDTTVPMLVMHDRQFKHSNTLVRHINDKVYFLLTKKDNRILFFTSLEQLKPHDKDDSNTITHSDEIFHKLYVGIYSKKENSLIYHRLSQTAVRAIKLKGSKQVLTEGEVLFADFNQRNHIDSLIITPEVFLEEDLQKIKTKEKS